MSSKRERISLRSFGIFALAIISLGFFTASPSYALDFYWVDGSGTWNDANNWSLTQGGPGGAGVPGYLDGIFVTQSDAVNRFVDFTGFNNLINGLSIGATGTGTMTFSIASGNIAGNAGFHGGTPFNISNSTINQSGGFISVSENTGLNIGNTIYNMSGGQVHSDAGVGIAFINISNSTINQTPNAGGFSVYDSGMNITKSVLNLSGGGFTTSGDISGLTISDSIINQTGG